MRTEKVFVSCAVLMAAGLLGGPLVMAADSSSGTNVPTDAPSPPPTSCSTGLFEMTVSSGPSAVDCSAPGGLCTEIEYEFSGGIPDHVAVLEGTGVWDVQPPGSQWYPACKGDEVTDLGERSCHEQAAKFNPTGAGQKFKVILAGQRKPGPTSIATKKGNKKGSCRILGIGLDASGAGPLDIVTTSKTQSFGDCIVTVKTPATGDVIVEIAEGSPEECFLLDSEGTALEDVELTVPGHEGPLTGLQAEAFSFVTSGSRCWSQVVPTPNGRLYTVCR